MRTTEDIKLAIDALVERERVRCLWSFRRDWKPTTNEERLHALQQIQKHGTRTAFQQASELQQWLSHSFSDASASS